MQIRVNFYHPTMFYLPVEKKSICGIINENVDRAFCSDLNFLKILRNDITSARSSHLKLKKICRLATIIVSVFKQTYRSTRLLKVVM